MAPKKLRQVKKSPRAPAGPDLRGLMKKLTSRGRNKEGRNLAVAKLVKFVYDNSKLSAPSQWSRRQAVYTLLVSTRGAMQALVEMLDLEKNKKEVVQGAVWLLHSDLVADSEEFKDELVKVGGEEALVELLESEDKDIATNAAGSLMCVMQVDPLDRSRGQTRVRQVYEAGALPALDRRLSDPRLSNGLQPTTATKASQALISMVNSGATGIEYAMLKYFCGVPDEHGVSGALPTQFPGLMDALREISEDFRSGGQAFATLLGGRSSPRSALFAALSEAIEAFKEHYKPKDMHYKAICDAAVAIFRARDA